MNIKTYGVIVTYKPDIIVLEDCINSIKMQLNKIIIVDNTPKADKNLEIFKNYSSIDIIHLGDNYGIAYAQNVGIKKALEENAEFILLSDQDTTYPTNFINDMLSCFNEENIAAAGPLFKDNHTNNIQFFIKKGCLGFKKIYPQNGKHEVLQLIASGTVLNAKYLKDIGLMREDLFIDWVDMEWCWRAIKKGYKIIGNADILINHTLGDRLINIKFKHIIYRKPTRNYYITRNAVYCSIYIDSLDIIHRVNLFVRSLTYIAKFSIFMPPHLKNLKYTMKGFYHGLIGEIGRLNEIT